MTNQQAIETCRRSKGVCAFTIADVRRTVLHYCDNDPSLARLIDELQIAVNSHLDQKSREAFIANSDEHEP